MTKLEKHAIAKANVRDQILRQSVANLKEFGWPGVTTENIITDQVYSMAFEGILKENRTGRADAVIDELLAEIDQARQKGAQ